MHSCGAIGTARAQSGSDAATGRAMSAWRSGPAATRTFYEPRGWPLDQWSSRGIELDNAVMGGFADVTFAIHLCRGNQESRWLVEGDYEPIARPIFKRIGATRLLLEYD